MTEWKESIFFQRIVSSSDFTAKIPIEIYHFYFEMGGGGSSPFFFFFLRAEGKDTRRVMRLKKGEREQERLFPLACAASKCSAVGQKGLRVIIDPPSVPDSPCPRA